MAQRHKLSDKDLVNRTATCIVDGPIKLSVNGRCQTAVNAISRAGKYRRKYGLDVSILDTIRCEICGGSTRIAYDHDHNTGKFRGWLCMKCNTSLGLVGDDIKILKKMISYLEKR